MNPTTNGMDCGRAMEQLDFYLDQELTAAEQGELNGHLDQCALCNRELTRRRELRDRLRSAVRGVAASDALRERIALDIRRTPAVRPRSEWQRWGAAAAAAVLIVVASATAYQLGHLRFTASSQESYLGSISQQVVNVMRVGLGDHVHCAVFRKYPHEAPSLEKIAEDMGPKFLPLVQLVREHLSGDQKVMLAHQCKYHGRKFVHMVVSDGSHLSSLVIAERQPGESFDTSGLRPALEDSGLPIYQSNVQRFQIHGFQTGGHLVYLVSDMAKDANERMMAGIAPSVREFLTKLEL
jgi:anti-sigma factor (TIGR02949 family)